MFFRHLPFPVHVGGAQLNIFTDHKPLTYAFSRVSDPWTARQDHQLSCVAEYASDIRHVAGVNNVVADTLSRPPAIISPSVTLGAAVPASAVTTVKKLLWSAIAALSAGRS